MIRRAVEHITIEMASGLLRGVPSANPVRTYVQAMLSDDEALAHLERRVNEMLVSRLPKSLLKSKVPGAMDVTEIPYHGEDAAESEHVRRSKRYGTQELPLLIVCKYSKGRYKRQGVCRFVYGYSRKFITQRTAIFLE